MANPTKWLWKMTSTEVYYAPFSVSYQLTLVTRQPLLEDQLTLALRHLFRKVPLLRACFGERDGEPWVREMSHETLDLEMLPDNAKADDLHRRLHSYEYNTQTGPLWCIKLRRDRNGSPDGEFREEVEGFPHMYSLFYGINHAITDGSSNVMISGFIAQLLDEVLAGKAIDDEEQFGIFVSDEKTKKLIQEQKAVVNADEELRRSLMEEYRELQEKRSYVKAIFKGDEEKSPQTVFLSRELDAAKTAAFIKRCRAEGVTVNSVFTAVASLAMVDVLAEGGLEQETYKIRSDHVLNARRYWGEDTSRYLGCHLMPLMPVVVETPRNVGEEGFWQYAKLMNEKLHKKIASGKPLQEVVMKELVTDGPDTGWQFDYFVSNMGEVTKLLAKGGSHVQVVHMVRTAAVDQVPCPFLFMVHTFRARHVISLVYNTHYVTPQLAGRFHEKVLDYYENKILN